MDQQLLLPLMTAAFVALAIYRRVRRNIGRQPVQPARMRTRMVMLGVIGALFTLSAMRHVDLIAALLAGVAMGAGLAWFGLRHTKFEKTDQGDFYTPHTYIGLAVSLLLLARIAYRFIAIYPSMHAAAQADQNPFAAFQRSPLTLAIFGVLIGYFVFYYAGVLRASKTVAATATPAISSEAR
jgi:cytochrome b561